MALQGNVRSLQALKKAIRKLPITAAAAIAARSAPEMSALAESAFDGGRSVYGPARPRGEDGQHLTLERTGDTRAALRFVATGRDIRLTRLPTYARYLIGKYDILPNGPLPQAWRERMQDIAAQVLHDAIFGARE